MSVPVFLTINTKTILSSYYMNCFMKILIDTQRDSKKELFLVQKLLHDLLDSEDSFRNTSSLEQSPRIPSQSRLDRKIQQAKEKSLSSENTSTASSSNEAPFIMDMFDSSPSSEQSPLEDSSVDSNADVLNDIEIIKY